MPLIYPLTERSLPGAVNDGISQQARAGRYGELFGLPQDTNMLHQCNEGQFFTAMTPTVGSAITLTGATQTSWVATTPNVLVRNTDAASGKRIILSSIVFDIGAAGTAGTRVEAAVLIDNTNRYSSGGTALTIANTNMDSGNASIALAFAGAITATAASGSVRNIYRRALQLANPAVGQTIEMRFAAPTFIGTGNPGASCGPVIIGPGHSFLLYLWLPSQTAAPTSEVTVSWWEQ